MKVLLLVLCALCLSGCGSNRQEAIHTEEQYTETTTTPDGQMTTTQGQRVINTQAQSETKIDLKPAIDPSWLSMIAGFFGGPQFANVLNIILGGYAMHQRSKANGMERMLDYTQSDLDEQWQMNKKRIS